MTTTTTNDVQRHYNPAVMTPDVQRFFEYDIRVHLEEQEGGYWSLREQALHIATSLANSFRGYNDDCLKKITLPQFFLLVSTLEELITNALFETKEEAWDGDGASFSDLPRKDADALCARILAVSLQTLYPDAFLAEPQGGGVGEEEEEQG